MTDRPENIADTIFLGGSILTMDDRIPEVRALAVRAGKILAAGTVEDIDRYRGPDTQTIDLAGKALMPGLIEPHSHPILSAWLYDWVDVSGFNHPTGESVMRELRRAAANTPDGRWITAFGYDPILTRDLKALNADVLDKISDRHPIMVMVQTMHTVYVNHKAFEIAGITDDTPQPAGGYFVKDEAGKLTGMVIEQGGIFPFALTMPMKTPAENADLIEKQFQRYSTAGYTTVCAAGLFPIIPNAMEMMHEMVRQSDSPMRLAIIARSDDLENGFKLPPETEDDRFVHAGVKFWYDGSPYTGNMLLDEPYLENPLMQEGLGLPKNNSGEAVLPKENLLALARKYHDRGMQIAIHGQGDRAIREILDVYETLLNESPGTDRRHRIEHGALFQFSDIQRAADLGITISWHVNHIHYYGEALRDEIIGPERAKRLMPLGESLKKGIVNSLHNDSPMYPAEPFKLIKTAVSRKTRQGSIVGPNLGIPVMEALKAVTIHAAWQMFMEDRIGSLGPGKYADLTVLSEDPRKTNPDDLDKIRVVQTWVAGRPTGGAAE